MGYATMQSANLRAFLGMLAISEIGPALLAASDDGYNVVVGSTARNPMLFGGYADHPRKSVQLVDKARRQYRSTAAGRYQVLARIFDHYKRDLNLPDFGKASQDAIATQLIRECKALPLIEAGRIEDAVHACASRWASLPGAGYGQNEHKLGFLVDAYKSCGGKVAS